MKSDQTAKAEAFRTLHERQGAFVIPNPWDAGTARILAALGFEALATTSAGLAFSLGRRDSEAAISREETLANARAIVSATDLPVSADLEDGFGPRPEDVAETIRCAAEMGLVGGSIEDTTADPARPLHDFDLAVERVAAAAEAAHALSFSFTLTARAENFQFSRPDLDDTIARLRAFEAAGADVLYAPGLPNIAAIRRVCASVSRPVNVVIGLAEQNFTVAELAEAGVKRISLGGTLYRAAFGGFLRAAREIKEHGTFQFVDQAVLFTEVSSYMSSTTE